MANYASQLGEAVGHAVETEIQRIVGEAVSPYGLFVDVGGKRPGKRKGQKLLMVNDTNTKYQIDLAIEDTNGNPFLLLESKYIRYKKHNRDKASWTCVAHYKLRTTYPTIRKSMAVLMGNWSGPSIKLMNSFGVETILIPFKHMVEVLAEYGIDFDWDEKDNRTPEKSWGKWSSLKKSEKTDIAKKIITSHASEIRRLVVEALESQDRPIENVEEVELLLKTSQEKYHLKKYKSVRDTLSFLLSLTTDVDNVKGKLG